MTCILTPVALAAAALNGCAPSPLARGTERDLRQSVLDSVRREMAQAEPFPGIRQAEPGAVAPPPIKPDLMPELERMAGPQSYDKSAFPMNEDLQGQRQAVLPITLERAVRTAATNNLSLQFARLQPAVSQSQIAAAEAAFDWVFFSNLDWSNLDEPRPVQTFGFSTVGVPTDQRTIIGNTTGLRRALPTGGQFTIQQQLTQTDVDTNGLRQVPNPNDEAAISLRFEQPLLRGFGSEVALAQVRLARNAERDQIANLKKQLIQTVTDTEAAYWNLVQAQRDLLILQRLLERQLTTRDAVRSRREWDATPPQISDAEARVQRRQADISQAQNVFRDASDRLKALMNDPALPVGSETLLVPIDEPLEAPVSYSLLGVISSAIMNRPEIQQAILSIDNTSIRKMVADNARLPNLNFRLETRFQGLHDNFGDAYTDIFDRQFMSYIMGLQFEQPIGNRLSEAQHRQRVIERLQATLAYQNTAQGIVAQAKQSLRAVINAYVLIGQRRNTRLAESENLRSYEVELKYVRGLRAEALAEQFRRQEALAQAEREEVGALIDYNKGLAGLSQSTGTALERNRIEFVVPDAPDASSPGYRPRNAPADPPTRP